MHRFLCGSKNIPLPRQALLLSLGLPEGDRSSPLLCFLGISLAECLGNPSGPSKSALNRSGSGCSQAEMHLTATLFPLPPFPALGHILGVRSSQGPHAPAVPRVTSDHLTRAHLLFRLHFRHLHPLSILVTWSLCRSSNNKHVPAPGPLPVPVPLPRCSSLNTLMDFALLFEAGLSSSVT